MPTLGWVGGSLYAYMAYMECLGYGNMEAFCIHIHVQSQFALQPFVVPLALMKREQIIVVDEDIDDHDAFGDVADDAMMLISVSLTIF